MQSQLLDITIIGCLVLLFASTYRKRATSMVRCWTAGWLLILIHFIALLPNPPSLLAQRILQSISISMLMACGAVFVFAVESKSGDRKLHRHIPLIAGTASISFVILVVFGVTAAFPFYLLVSVRAICWLVYSIRMRHTPAVIRNLLLLNNVVSTAWLVWTIVHGREDVGLSALLMQLYLYVALIYIGRFRKVSAGSFTVVFGLLAWAAVFPVCQILEHIGSLAGISPEFWNVPKYFVAFGMMLILLEEEIGTANEAGKHYQVLFDANPHPMWIYDRQTLAFQGVNDAALDQYGYTRDQFLRMTLEDLRPPDVFAVPAEPHTRGIRQHRKSDGSVCVVDVATHPIQSNGRDLACSLIQDVTERELLHERLHHQAHHDLLTGLANRAWLEEKLRQTISHSERHNRQSALLCLDVDRFKQINDTYGHGVGDLCLQEVANRLSQRVRITDVAARIGGEEFSLLLHEIGRKEDAEQFASEILAALRVPIQADSYSIELTGSIGIAIFPFDGIDANTLWRNADAAMYRAKKAGGNQYLCMSPEISQLASDANEMERSVRRALKGEGLEVHYQPLYRIDGELHSLEALLRFRHPVFGFVSPSRFVPVAEESGLIVPLGSWVLNEVCRQTAQWQREGLPVVPVAINISPLQVTRPDFAAQAMDVLATHQLDPRLLGMEITETAMMRNIGEAARQIKTLADIGVAFSVDDFGTGYSSLGQLDKLAVQSLKIDRSFTDRVCGVDSTHSIVSAIISMAHSLRLEVVAEGVETQEQWDCLHTMNCDIVQGYLFSKAVPASEVHSLLLNGRPPRPAPVSVHEHARVA